MTFPSPFLTLTALFLGLFNIGVVSAFTSNIASAQRTSPLHAYVPQGLTADEYKRIKSKEQQKVQGKNLGALGPQGFKSRSMLSWQQAFERGETGHSIAPVGYKEALAKGRIGKKDVPYMVRGGHWDNSDVFGAKRLRWLKSDKAYAKGGYKKEQSASILGSGPGFDWTGKRTKGPWTSTVPGLS